MDAPAQPALRTTVLIVSRNCAPALRRCLTSLEQSDGRETIEILVVDAGSTDGSATLDVEFENVTILRLPRNFGRTKARNIGTRTAKGKYLFLLSPDTEVQPDTVGTLADFLDAEPSVTAVSPVLTTPTGEPATHAGLLPTPKELMATWRAGEPWSAPLGPTASVSGHQPIDVDSPDPRATLVRTQAIRGMNYFDERYGEFGSALELPALAARAGKRMALLAACRAVTHDGEGLAAPATSAERDELLADYAHGVATYAGKHYGFLAGLGARLRMLVWALIRLRLPLLVRMVSASKIDGSQSGS